MIIQAKVSPGKKESRLEIIDGIFAVELKERAEMLRNPLISGTPETMFPSENKANIALIKLLAKHFNTSSANVRIVKGLSSRNKTIEIKQ